MQADPTMTLYKSNKVSFRLSFFKEEHCTRTWNTFLSVATHQLPKAYRLITCFISSTIRNHNGHMLHAFDEAEPYLLPDWWHHQLGSWEGLRKKFHTCDVPWCHAPDMYFCTLGYMYCLYCTMTPNIDVPTFLQTWGRGAEFVGGPLSCGKRKGWASMSYRGLLKAFGWIWSILRTFGWRPLNFIESFRIFVLFLAQRLEQWPCHGNLRVHRCHTECLLCVRLLVISLLCNSRRLQSDKPTSWWPLSAYHAITKPVMSRKHDRPRSSSAHVWVSHMGE